MSCLTLLLLYIFTISPPWDTEGFWESGTRPRKLVELSLFGVYFVVWESHTMLPLFYLKMCFMMIFWHFFCRIKIFISFLFFVLFLLNILVSFFFYIFFLLVWCLSLFFFIIIKHISFFLYNNKFFTNVTI